MVAIKEISDSLQAKLDDMSTQIKAIAVRPVTPSDKEAITQTDDGGDSSGLNTDLKRADYNSHSAKTGGQPFKKHLEREKRLRKGSRTGSKAMRRD